MTMKASPVIAWCDRIITSGFYLLFGLVPFLLTPWNYELFEYNKMMAVYGIAAIITASWLVKMITLQEFRIQKTPLDIPIVLLFLSQLISAIFSIDPHVSWFGYYSRFNGGMWSVISYILLYYALVSNTNIFHDPAGKSDAVEGIHETSRKKGKELPMPPPTFSILRLLRVTLTTAFIIALYAVFEHFGIDKHIWVQDVQNRVFSTLGQPNWLAAYLVALIPLTWSFALTSQIPHLNQASFKLQQQKISKHSLLQLHFGFDLTLAFWIWTTLSGLFFLVLLYTRSRSGLLGLACADVAFWGCVVSSFRGANLSNFAVAKPDTSSQKGSLSHIAKYRGLALKSAVLGHALFVLIVFFNGTYIPAIDRYATLTGIKTLITNPASFKQTAMPSASNYTAPALETGGTESGTIRTYVWNGAIRAWQSSLKTKLIGTGTETFAFAFYQYRPIEHNRTSEWDFLYNKAHNEYLNYLATTGIFGFGSYLLLIGLFVHWFIRRQCINASMRQNTKTDAAYPAGYELSPFHYALFAGWISILVTNFFGFSVVVVQLILFLFPAIIFASSRRFQSYKNQAMYQVKLPPWTIWIPIIAGVYLLGTICSFWYADKQFATGYQLDRTGLYNQATANLMKATALNTKEPLYHDELATNYAALAVGSFTAGNATQAANLAQLALAESDIAIRTSPNNVNFLKSQTKVYYTLSSLNPSFNARAITTLKKALVLSPNDPKIYYNLAILTGREGQNDQAIEYLLKAKKLKNDYRDAYNALYIFYNETGKKKDAQAIIEAYLTTINPTDQQFQKLIRE